MIKAYSVRYKEEMRVIDVEEREDAIHARAAEAAASAAFVGGLRAIALEEQEGAEPFPEGMETEGVISDSEDEEGGVCIGMDHAALEAWKEEERKKLKCELIEAEKIALRIEMEKAIRTQADIILEQARAQGEQLKTKAKLVAEEEKVQIFDAAKQEGYEAGRQMLLQEQEALNASYTEKEQLLKEQYEMKLQELEPMATEVVIRLLENLTGVCLETKNEIITYLVSKALSDAERSNTFLIKVSKEDYEEVRGAADSFRAMFEREVTLEIVQDSLLKKGECMIETDSNIIDCSLGTQLEGLIEDIRLLSVQERV
ncbi:MAG: hypothetical protein IKB07_13565 [Lachnospiraceae bacterium]|nr:hypothetical protein [Lachnospiraceae bacterium]